MTTAEGLLTAGESGEIPIVAGDPDGSYLFRQVMTDAAGHAEMPKNAPALTGAELETLRTWIREGASLDAMRETAPIFTAENPPVYTRPALITSLDVSRDGQFLAVAGYHEVLLYRLPAPEVTSTESLTAAFEAGLPLEHRLIGISERIETVRFSPDGTRLAVAGGNPGLFGELQIWSVADGNLSLSVRTTNDTIAGASWSPDGKLVAYGGFDKSVRAIDSTTGEQVLFNGTHDDFVLDTTFSPDGKYVISVSRDMSVKLTEVSTQRFVDNITSITPGALRGGVNAVCVHP